MTYEEIKEYFKSLPAFVPKKDAFHLDNMQVLMQRLGNPQNELSVVHFTGTNGKGSSLNFVYEILCESGVWAGSFTSPYLKDYEEMIRLGGRRIAKEDFCLFFQQVLDACKDDVRASEFEFLTALAFVYFKEKGCKLLLLEVGLGGRLDATNVIAHSLLSVCTRVDFDHMQIWGDSLLAIAREKAGIIKENSAFMTLSQEKEVKELFQEVCRKKRSCFYEAFPAQNIRKEGLKGQYFDLYAANMRDIHISMLGEHQADNAALALQIACFLQKDFASITEESMRKGLQKACWQGRLTMLHKEPYILVDGAHNAAGIRMLCRSLQSLFGEQKIHFVMGVLADKDYTSMIEALCPMAASFYTITPPSSRALPAQRLQEQIQKAGGKAYVQGSLEESLDILRRQLRKDEIVLILGSLYQVQEAYRYFGKSL